MILLGFLLRAIVLIFLFVAGACITWLGLYAGRPLLALIAGLAALAGCVFLVARSPRKLALCSSAVVLVVGAGAILYFVVVPLVVFKINARAFPGHMVVEFQEGCLDGTRGILRRRIEYVVSASGYGCSSTHLPGWFRLSLVFYDDDPNMTREPPPLAEGTFFFTGHSTVVVQAAHMRIKISPSLGGRGRHGMTSWNASTSSAAWNRLTSQYSGPGLAMLAPAADRES